MLYSLLIIVLGLGGIFDGSLALAAATTLPTAQLAPQSDGSLAKIASRRVRDYTNAPEWIKSLEQKQISAYFGGSDPSKGLSRAELDNLWKDAARLHIYFEGGAEGKKFAGFVKGRLSKFVMGLNTQKLKSFDPAVEDLGPLENWTVEELVAVQQVAYLERYPHFFTRAMDLMSGPNLKGASYLGGLATLTAILGYSAYRHPFIGGIFFGAILTELRMGPLSQITNAATSWFLTPTMEFLKVINARYLGWLEQIINHGFDRAKPKDDLLGKEDAGNTTPRVAEIHEDGMNFANMTPEDQLANWNKNLRMWVGVAKRFGQLLRDTHHSGRFLMMISWSDEQAAAALIETVNAKLVTLDVETETILIPFKTSFLVRGELEKKLELERLIDEDVRLSKMTWMEPDLSEERLNEIVVKIEEVQKKLLDLGLTERDLRILNTIEETRARAVGTLVTAAALNEVRSFGTAEANRNLEPEARQAQRVARKGLHLQDYVDEYLPLIQHQMRAMGYVNTGSSTPPKKTDNCWLYLSSLSSRVHKSVETPVKTP